MSDSGRVIGEDNPHHPNYSGEKRVSDKPPDDPLDLLREIVGMHRQRRHRAAAAGATPDEIDTIYIDELHARLDLAREQLRQEESR